MFNNVDNVIEDMYTLNVKVVCGIGFIISSTAIGFNIICIIGEWKKYIYIQMIENIIYVYY